MSIRNGHCRLSKNDILQADYQNPFVLGTPDTDRHSIPVRLRVPPYFPYAAGPVWQSCSTGSRSPGKSHRRHSKASHTHGDRRRVENAEVLTEAAEAQSPVLEPPNAPPQNSDPPVAGLLPIMFPVGQMPASPHRHAEQ